MPWYSASGVATNCCESESADWCKADAAVFATLAPILLIIQPMQFLMSPSYPGKKCSCDKT